MSDIYSVPKEPATASRKGLAYQWVNTNTVLQHLLHQLNVEDRKAIVLRCDELPLLQCTEEDLANIFSWLLKMILQKKEQAGQLFLHINCKTVFEESLSTGGTRQYSIQFNTNILPCADWMHTNKKELDEMSAILQQYNGSLQMAESQGCIFSLSLPGKHL